MGEMTQSAVPRHHDKLLRYLNGQEDVPLGECVINSVESRSLRPVTKVNIGYIVCAVLFNEQNQVLLIEEAKSSCRGEWYLPAGRMEQGETIIQAVQREVLEETGLQFEPTTLLCVEVQGVLWYRFTFTGVVTGGSLKTLQQQDKESLQAGWFPLNVVTMPTSDVPLRAKDIVPLVQQAVKYRSLTVDNRHTACLPLDVAHTAVVIRVCFIYTHDHGDSGKVYHYLRFKDPKSSNPPPLAFPAISINPREMSLMITVMRLIQEVFSERPKSHVDGIIGLEYSGRDGNDGLCVNILCSVSSRTTSNNTPPSVKSKNYEWVIIETEERDLLQCIKLKLQDTGSIPLMSCDC